MSSKLREAVEEIIDLIDKWRTDGAMEHWQYSQLFDIADAALAEPLRNCDIGTAEEQGMRFKKFCNDHQAPWHGCTNCPVLMSEKCAIAWAQMPYETVKTNKGE